MVLGDYNAGAPGDGVYHCAMERSNMVAAVSMSIMLICIDAGDGG